MMYSGECGNPLIRKIELGHGANTCIGNNGFFFPLALKLRGTASKLCDGKIQTKWDKISSQVQK